MRIGFCVALAAGLMVACHDENIASHATITGTESLAFSPMTVIIEPGGDVTWRFFGVGHSVIFDGAVAGAPQDITGTNANTEIARTFSAVGTYPYHCVIHPQMVGQVIVVDAGSASVTGS